MIDKTTEFNIKVVKLPENGLSSLAHYYESYGGDNVPILPIVIYNVEQLADEITKRLKDCIDNSRKGNDDSSKADLT